MLKKWSSTQEKNVFLIIDCNKDRILFIWLLMTTVMDEFDQSDLVKERNDFNNNCYQISMHYKEIENAFIKNFSCLCYKTRGNHV